MSDDSGSDSSNDSSEDSSSASDTEESALGAHKDQRADSETFVRANAGTKNSDNSDQEIAKKSADKEPSEGNEVPSVDDVSIPSSVDPDAPANSNKDGSDSSSNSESSE